jgi:hypothetical protein
VSWGHRLQWTGSLVFRELTRRRPVKGAVFHHVPKCAGVSVYNSLAHCYWPNKVRPIIPRPSYTAARATEIIGTHFKNLGTENTIFFDSVQLFRQCMLLYNLEAGASFSGGHVHYSPGIHDRFRDTHLFVTVLREPTSRFLSHYFYSSKSASHDRIDMTLEEAVETLGPKWGASQVAYFAGAGANLRPTPAEAVVRAKVNLARLDVVGLVENLPAFVRGLEHALKTPLFLQHANRSPTKRRPEDTISASLMDKIRELCGPDIELYEHARKLSASGNDKAS